jgi:hypothetical protein
MTPDARAVTDPHNETGCYSAGNETNDLIGSLTLHPAAARVHKLLHRARRGHRHANAGLGLLHEPA